MCNVLLLMALIIRPQYKRIFQPTLLRMAKDAHDRSGEV